MIPPGAGVTVVLSLTLISSLHAAYLTKDGEDEAPTQTGPVKEHKEVHTAGSLLWSSQTSRDNMDTTTQPMATGLPFLTNLLATSSNSASQVHGKVFNVLGYTTSPDRRRPEMRLGDAWEFRDPKANAQRSDITRLKPKQTDPLTTLQDDRRMVEELTRRPPHLGTGSSRGKHFYLFI